MGSILSSVRSKRSKVRINRPVSNKLKAQRTNGIPVFNSNFSRNCGTPKSLFDIKTLDVADARQQLSDLPIEKVPSINTRKPYHNVADPSNPQTGSPHDETNKNDNFNFTSVI